MLVLQEIPFLVEDELKAAGGKYTCGDVWAAYAVQDGKLITGQNPQSAEKLAQLVTDALKCGRAEQSGSRWERRASERRASRLLLQPNERSQTDFRPRTIA